ncbi:MAG: GDSL-type esterase/lipase family protein [Candidatus Heimdallarchaeaceae archaeon]
MKKLTSLLLFFAITLTMYVAQPVAADVAIDSSLDFSNKKIVFLGDSITDGLPSEENTYTELVADELGFGVAVNYGLSSSAITEDANDTASLVERYATMDNDADYVIVFGGVNDYTYDAPMGLTTSSDTTEFNGALNELYSGLITRYYPNATIFVMTPLSSRIDDLPDTTENEESLGLDDYVDAMIAAAVDGINIIDLYSISNMNMATSDSDVALFTSDGKHPNDRGHRRIADILISIIGGENLYTNANMTENRYFKASDGTEVGNTETDTTDYISVEEGREYIVYGSKYHADSYTTGDITLAQHHTFWDRADIFVSGEASYQEYNVFTVPTDARSVRITVYDGSELYQSLREIKNYIQVDFDLDGANSSQSPLKVDVANTSISEPNIPIKVDEDFLGWYKDANFTDEYDFLADVVTDDMTLYAKWTDSEVTGTGISLLTSPTDTLEFYGIAWYWYAIVLGAAVYYFGFNKNGKKAFKKFTK